MADGDEGLLQQLLQVRLAHVDDVVGGGGRDEGRMHGLREVRVAGGGEQRGAVNAGGEGAVLEIAAEDA